MAISSSMAVSEFKERNACVVKEYYAVVALGLWSILSTAAVV